MLSPYPTTNEKTERNESHSLLWKRILNSIQKELHQLIFTDSNTSNKQSIKSILTQQCINDHETCLNDINSIFECPSVKRIKIILKTYQILSQNEWNIPITQEIISPIVTISNIYELQEIVNDFIHIQSIHINKNAKIGEILREKFSNKFECNQDSKCNAFRRHYGNRYPYRIHHSCVKTNKLSCNNDESDLQQQCDKMHCYFLHFKNLRDTINNLEINEHNGKCYIGNKEDEEWIKNFDDCLNDENGYQSLVTNIPMFSYQTPYGFRIGQNRAISHIKPHFTNIQEEVLNNKFKKILLDNWNETSRKAKIFCNSIAAKTITTSHNGYYIDQIFETDESWKKGIEITVEEIIMLKLYTDYDPLQFELKKCFRYNPHDKMQKLEHVQRLSEFYNWRVGLLVVLNKFGCYMFHMENNIKLYHGVSSKMLLNIHPTLAFCGPLSTSSSYKVANHFATANGCLNGMVLEVTSAYPKSKYCTAFDASLISDFPEESEWIIGSAYLRISAVTTKPLVKQYNMGKLLHGVPHASIVKEIFFTIHLFMKSVFCMSEHLELYLIGFIQCCLYFDDEEFWKHYNENNVNCQYELNDVCIWLKKNIFVNNEVKENKMRNVIHILHVLWNNFNEFRISKRNITIDNISDGLKPYLLDKDTNVSLIHTKDKWVISLDKIIKLFPNIEQITFLNIYKFDNVCCAKLIKQIDNEIKVNNLLLKDIEKKKSKLKRLTFLYNDYYEELPTPDHFYHPQNLRKEYLNKLEQNKWKLVFKKNANIGYKIQLSEVLSPKKLNNILLKINV